MFNKDPRKNKTYKTTTKIIIIVLKHLSKKKDKQKKEICFTVIVKDLSCVITFCTSVLE